MEEFHVYPSTKLPGIIVDTKLVVRAGQRTQKDERLKLFEGSGTRDVGTWSPVMELPFPLPASRHNSPVPASRSVFPFVEIFNFIKNKHRL
jgi:hypothetical protein